MELKTTHFIGIGIGFFLLGISFFLTTGSVQIFLTGIGLLIMILPFVFELIQETKNQTEKEEMFLEFARNLVETCVRANYE